MTIPVNISVRLKTSRQDIHVTDDIADVQYGTASPGGFAECTISLFRPISFTPGEIAQFGEMAVYDACSAETLFEGIMQDPGRSAGDGGQVWEIVAVGGSSHLVDDTRQLIYVDTDVNKFEKIDNTTAGSTVDYLTDTGASSSVETPALVLKIPQGTSVDGAIPSRAVSAHRGISAAGQKLSRVSFTWDAGLTSGNLTASVYAATQGVGAADVAWTATFNIAGGTVDAVIVTDWAAANDRDKPIIRFHYTAAAGTASADTWWLQITDLVVRTVLYDQTGVEILTAAPYNVTTVLASEIVADLLGRILVDTVDGANATIATTAFPIEHLAYPDGVSPTQVLEDLIAFENAYTYHLWEINPDNGKFRFEWVQWPTDVRYEADVNDGFSAPGSGATVYDQVQVRWHNRGTVRVSLRTQDVPALTAAGYHRTAFIDLGDEASTQANAHRVGDQFLEEHRFPVNAGSLVVRDPIIDHLTGRMVQPHAIRAGNLIRVRGVESYTDSLNSDGRDGLTVFRIAATNYSAADAAATLSLDAYSPSLARTLASLTRRQTVRRR